MMEEVMPTMWPFVAWCPGCWWPAGWWRSARSP